MKNSKNDCLNYDFTYCNCRVLNRDNCLGCSFYTNRNVSVMHRLAAKRRLQELPLEQQVHIAEKYYNGIAVWNLDAGERIRV